MDFAILVTAVLAMGILGLIVGVGLAVASKVFYVYVDPLVSAVEAAMPGANCGGCGQPGCSANAAAIVAGLASPSSCVAGGPDVAAAIAAALGVSLKAAEPDVSRPGCHFGTGEAEARFDYRGLSDCRAAHYLQGGMKVCQVGCLGLGTCVSACIFGALSLGPDRLPVVDEKKCTGCGACERTCPRHIIRLTSLTRRILRELTEDECTTPCERACPAGLEIRRYVGLAAAGDFAGSLAVIKERMPFPGVIGRICPHPCETACRRNLVDEAVSINCVKRFTADLERESGERILPRKAPESGLSFAVAGGGVEGLSTAYFLARLGHSALVLEAGEKAGGLLRTAIREDRLPHEVLDHEIGGILALGVTLKSMTALGRDVTAAELLASGHAALFIAPGGWDSRISRMGGERPAPPLPGLHLLIDVMKHGPADLGERPVFVGGGASAIAAAPDGATLVLRASPDEPSSGRSVEMLAGFAVTALFGLGERLTGVAVTNLSTGQSSEIPATAVVFASGRVPEMMVRKRPAADENQPGMPPVDPSLLSWEALSPRKNPAAGGGTGFLAASEPLTDFSAAVAAIGAGRRAAASLHLLATGAFPASEAGLLTPSSFIQDLTELHQVEPVPRNSPPHRASGSHELEAVFSRETTLAEAGRCLQCGLVCYRKTAPKEDAGLC